MSKLSDAVDRAEREATEPTDLAETEAFGPIDQAQILRLIGLNPRDPKAHAVVAVARRYSLDPVLGHIAIIPRSSMPYITRDGYLHIAHRSQHLDGIEVRDGPRREGSEWVAAVAVYRDDMTHPFVYPGRANVAADNGPEMAIARAERRALKRAFSVTLPGEFGDDDGIVSGTVAAASALERRLAPEPPAAAPNAPQDDEPAAALPEGATLIRDVPLPPDPPAAPREISGQQRRAIFAHCQRLGMAADDARDTRLAVISRIVGREISSTTQLTEDEASTVISALADMEYIPTEERTDE